jgi:hypothetical protein
LVDDQVNVTVSFLWTKVDEACRFTVGLAGGASTGGGGGGVVATGFFAQAAPRATTTSSVLNRALAYVRVRILFFFLL